MLRTSIEGKPLVLIKRIGSDYVAACKYLDSIYGDPRFVSDTITEELSEAEQSKCVKLFAEMKELNHVSFDRCLTPDETIGLPTLFIFADNSQDAFGAVAYIRWKTSDGSYKDRFIAAKSRVSPLKQLSIPRLEL